ncbi:hypothetical protein [Aneurinibacillus sp. REN35]|uniref:hypothetical protein n=1 Tax=Aneurinibacillus sp. REN35 TaxID=3237286 RepID=UPI003527FA40
MEAWRQIKPAEGITTTNIALGAETMGETLNRLAFQDIYRRVGEDGIMYFPRATADGDVEICIVYQDIDSFGEQAEASVYLDFSKHQHNWIAVLWVVDDPEDPLGYPLSFQTTVETDRYLAVRFLEQPRIWVHYLAEAEEGIMHLYSEAIAFDNGEQVERAGEMLLAAYRYDPSVEEAEDLPEQVMRGDALSYACLKENGLSFYFDYRLMENRFGEEGAREQVMGAIYRSLWMMRRHPNAQARDAELLLWIGEKRGRNRADEETHLLVVTMTPQLLDVYQIVHMSELEANPLATMLMALTEYQYLEEEHPIEQGYIPIIKYEYGTLVHIEWEEESISRLHEAYLDAHPGQVFSPYRKPI